MTRHSRTLGDESFLRGTSSAYIDEMYRSWRNDPNSVHKSWDAYFKTGAFTTAPSTSRASDLTHEVSSLPGDNSVLKVVQMVRAYQVRGHLLADIDPLRLTNHGVDNQLISRDV
jgi:2-oxoglutarate dehydrogenase E1 component